MLSHVGNGRNYNWNYGILRLEKGLGRQPQFHFTSSASFAPRFLSVEREAVSLNLVIFNIAINACEKASEWQQALAWLDEAATEARYKLGL